MAKQNFKFVSSAKRVRDSKTKVWVVEPVTKPYGENKIKIFSNKGEADKYYNSIKLKNNYDAVYMKKYGSKYTIIYSEPMKSKINVGGEITEK